MREKKLLLESIKNYSEEEKAKIIKAYETAATLHHGQLRESGEAYIVHPLNVAIILCELHADSDTICAGLLHDTLEDTNIKKEEIAELFNSDVANLVDGVTKISKLNFSSKSEANAANTKKIILGLTSDVRIIIIKLADRLHNMRTLDFKSEFKQKENSLETLEIFCPLAYYIGAYHIKSELEDLSLKYLKPKTYLEISEKIDFISNLNNEWIKEMITNIKKIMEDENIPHEIKFRVKNIYGIYKMLESGNKLNDIHDLYALKIIVDEIIDCYKTLGLVHSLYNPINSRFKDYISKPKTNNYRSLHTTVFAPSNHLVQTQIRTREMDKVASFGLTAYWDIKGPKARLLMQEDLKSKYQFFTSLLEINRVFGDNREFVNQVKKELFASKIYVYTTKGDIIELPVGSTVIDFAYHIHTDIGNTMIGAKVNDEYVGVDYVLHNKDIVEVLTDDLSFGPRESWLRLAKTTRARRKIKDFNKRL